MLPDINTSGFVSKFSRKKVKVYALDVSRVAQSV
jgi:hypothetical protein